MMMTNSILHKGRALRWGSAVPKRLSTHKSTEKKRETAAVSSDILDEQIDAQWTR